MLLPRAAVAVSLLLLLAGCGEQDSVEAPPPGSVVPPGEWDLSKLPKVDAPIRESTTPGGTLVKVLKEGREPPPKTPRDIKYVGYHLSGKKFDEGVLPGERLKDITPLDGWKEGLEGIKLREKRRILVPWSQAYKGEGVLGRRGEPPAIAPYENVVFDVEWVQLEITDVQVGSGPEAKAGSKVTVHYVGTLADGTVFDSSRERPDPETFTLKTGQGGVIEGWVKGIAGMRAGGVRRLWIPSHMGYGGRGNGKIPPHADLTFVVELLHVD